MKVGVALVAAAHVASVAAYEKPHYKVYNTVVQFGSAVRNCEAAGGAIAHVHTRGQNDQVTAAAQAAGVTTFWLAGMRIPGSADNSDASWAWTSDGVSADSGNFNDFRLPDFDGDGSTDLWARKEPNNYRNEEDCVKSVVGTGWNDARCWSKAAYACWFKGKIFFVYFGRKTKLFFTFFSMKFVSKSPHLRVVEGCLQTVCFTLTVRTQGSMRV